MNIRKTVDYSAMFAALEAVMEADLPQMELYCEIGKAVCARSEKGAAVSAAEFLKERYPDMTGFSPRNVRRMRDFWQLYSDMPELLGEALRLNWTQNVVIMETELPTEERRWYIWQAAAQNLSKSELLRMITDSAYLESVLDEKVDVWYNKNNDEISERTQYEEDSVYLPWKYRNRNEIPLELQWLFTWNFLKLHHFYTNDPTEPELTKIEKATGSGETVEKSCCFLK